MSELVNKEESYSHSSNALVSRALGYISAFWWPHLIHTASELRIYDIVSKEPMSTDELAKATGTHSKTLFRFMRALAFMDVFKLDDEQKWTVAPLATVLFTKIRNYASAWMDTYTLLQTLTDVVKTGRSHFEDHYGLPFYDWYKTKPKEMETFNLAMPEYGHCFDFKLKEWYDFSQFQRIVDVGGGRGIFMSEVLKSAPNAKGTVYDQPVVVEAAQENNAEIEEVRDRITFVGGSFLSSVPSGGDCYIIRNVLNDYDDNNVLQILKNIANEMNEKSKLLIIEQEPDTPLGSIFDLQMFMVLDGIARGEQGFQELLPKAGLRTNKYIKTGGDTFSIIEVIKIIE